MRKRLAALAVVAIAALGVAGCGNSEQGSGVGGSFHEQEAEYLEQHEHVGHQEAEREASEAEELTERIQRSGIKTGP